MRPYAFRTFGEAIDQAKIQLLHKSKIVHSDHWQGMDITAKPEMATHELTHCVFSVDMDGMMYDDEKALRGNFLGVLQNDIKPNLPWADDHFEERVSGAPMNPGAEWLNWPYGASAARFLEDGKFNHNYMERYWPKLAGVIDPPTADYNEWQAEFSSLPQGISPHHGIKYEYGDLGDVCALLASDPLTRQAYLPVWFPEDTGGGSKRAPCTLGYHFLCRDGRLDVSYTIRSCDFVRHFRDDIYLTARLVEWVIGHSRRLATGSRSTFWDDVRPGRFVMSIGSLHVFRNDYPLLRS